MPADRKKLSLCPIERTLAVLSGRWKAAVVWSLFSGGQRYSDLLRLDPGLGRASSHAGPARAVGGRRNREG